jgi:hypothetical protein
MSLIIEDGSGLANGQSYATVQEMKDYAKLRNADVPSGTGDCEVLLLKAMDALQAIPNFQGQKRTKDQALLWPRVWADIEDWPILSNEIPRQLIQAQCAIAIEINGGVDFLPLAPAAAQGVLVESTVGPITQVWSNPGSVSRVPASAKADALLRVLLKRNGLFGIRA